MVLKGSKVVDVNQTAANGAGVREREPLSVRNAALYALVGVFTLCSLVWALSVVAHDRNRALMIVAVPIGLVLLALVTANRPLVLAAFSICMLVGLLGIFSIGLPILVTGICLMAWYSFRTSPASGKSFTWNDLLYANLIVLPFVIYFMIWVVR